MDLDLIRSSFDSNNTFVIPEEYEIDSDIWSKVLNDPGYNNMDSLVPASSFELDDTRESVQKAIMQFVLSRKPVDFPPNTSNRLSSDDETEAHHILPLASASFNTVSQSTAELRNNPKHYLNSALNFALISKNSNRSIGAMSYSDYSNHFTPEVYGHYCMPHTIPDSGENGQLVWLRERHELLRQKLHSTLQELSRA